MTIPYLMNCAHNKNTRCLDCIKKDYVVLISKINNLENICLEALDAMRYYRNRPDNFDLSLSIEKDNKVIVAIEELGIENKCKPQ